MANKKKFGIHALSAQLGDTAADSESASHAKSGEKRVSSPINSPALTVRSKRQQRMYLDMPVSKTTVECDLIEVDPRHCIASPLNKRVQSLLSADDVAVQQLLNSMRGEGQRDPVLVRHLKQPEGDLRYEVIYGTRRRYVASRGAYVGPWERFGVPCEVLERLGSEPDTKGRWRLENGGRPIVRNSAAVRKLLTAKRYVPKPAEANPHPLSGGNA